jgi:hypothetical protein
MKRINRKKLKRKKLMRGSNPGKLAEELTGTTVYYASVATV